LLIICSWNAPLMPLPPPPARRRRTALQLLARHMHAGWQRHAFYLSAHLAITNDSPLCF